MFLVSIKVSFMKNKAVLSCITMRENIFSADIDCKTF